MESTRQPFLGSTSQQLQASVGKAKTIDNKEQLWRKRTSAMSAPVLINDPNGGEQDSAHSRMANQSERGVETGDRRCVRGMSERALYRFPKGTSRKKLLFLCSVSTKQTKKKLPELLFCRALAPATASAWDYGIFIKTKWEDCGSVR